MRSALFAIESQFSNLTEQVSLTISLTYLVLVELSWSGTNQSCRLAQTTRKGKPKLLNNFDFKDGNIIAEEVEFDDSLAM